jgi:hypothetical protein
MDLALFLLDMKIRFNVAADESDDVVNGSRRERQFQQRRTKTAT